MGVQTPQHSTEEIKNTPDLAVGGSFEAFRVRVHLFCSEKAFWKTIK